VIRRPLIGALLVAAAVAAAAFPAAAGAQAVVNAQDPANVFVPDRVEIDPGGAVSWQWSMATTIHDLWLQPPGEEEEQLSLECDPVNGLCTNASDPIERTFTEELVYPFYCKLHGGDAEGNGMAGRVVVGEADENGGPNPMPNPTEPPSRWEQGDNKRPRLSGVRARGIRRGARVRFRLSERGRVIVRFKRGGRTVYAKRLRRLKRGVTRRRIRHRRLRPGRYRLVIRARDRAGNPSRPRSARVTVRG
jgi:plastocyanin